MREKELRLALVCYGGISLAIYMHGITKEIWHLVRASRDCNEPADTLSGTLGVYHDLLNHIIELTDTRIRVITDIIAGASAGGINGIFLAQAIQNGQSLEPLTDLWLTNGDVERLLDPDARPAARFTKFWATPLVWLLARHKGDTVDRTVAPETREEVRRKLSHFIRSRWFQPPFGGETFTNMLLEALDSMAQTPDGTPCLPEGYPLDLMVTVTDFDGYPEVLRLNSPPEVLETEHRLTISFRARNRSDTLADTAELLFAARATASFPGAFPPFTVRELDKVLQKAGRVWPGRDSFLRRILPSRAAMGTTEEAALIDGSVLINAPFAPAIAALRNRPSRREVDRRFVYIDPRPTGRAIAMPGSERRSDKTRGPGFFRAMLGSLSDIPREQPIRDNLEAIEARSRLIRSMRRITDALREEIERDIEATFGHTLFLDYPTPARLAAWRSKAHTRSAMASGFAYPAYAHVKLAGIIEETTDLCVRFGEDRSSKHKEAVRAALWRYAGDLGLEQMRAEQRGGARPEIIIFFRDHDLGFRIRRLRFMARRLSETLEVSTMAPPAALIAIREAIYGALSLYQECEARDFYGEAAVEAAKNIICDPGLALERLAAARDLRMRDDQADKLLADALGLLPKEERRPMLFAYLGFSFYDIATLPLLQGEGLDEFDPIKVDRISPEDCSAIRRGGAEATLRGIELNNFGAFFSRAYRENDYLWGRLHGAERLVDIILSTVPAGKSMPAGLRKTYLRRAFNAILEEEEKRLTNAADIIAQIRQEMEEQEE